MLAIAESAALYCEALTEKRLCLGKPDANDEEGMGKAAKESKVEPNNDSKAYIPEICSTGDRPPPPSRLQFRSHDDPIGDRAVRKRSFDDAVSLVEADQRQRRKIEPGCENPGSSESRENLEIKKASSSSIPIVGKSTIADASSVAKVEGQAPAFPEDTVFFHMHLERGGRLRRVDDVLVMYRCVEEVLRAKSRHCPNHFHRYSPSSMSFRIHRRLLLRYRLRAFERRVSG